MSTHQLAWALMLSTLWISPVSAGPPASIQPLSDADRKTFWGSAEDAKPKRLDGVTKKQEGKHYVTSNEGFLDLFHAPLKNLGGAYAGVGTDQAYLFIGWQRPTLAWLTDYDPVVGDVHRVYHVFFKKASSPDELLKFWSKSSAKATAALLSKEKNGALLAKTFRRYRYKIDKRLKSVKKHMTAQKVPTFLTDQATFDYVRALIQAGRVRPMLANLLSYRGFHGIAKVSKALGVPIRVLYTSNAEQYWRYSDRFRKNMKRLPTDDRSLMVRTLLTWKRNRDYRYVVQPFALFKTWLGTGVRSVGGMIKPRRDKSKKVQFLRFEKAPRAKK